MKRIFSITSVLTTFILFGSSTVFAQTNTAVYGAYWKSSGKYDVVVHDGAGAKLKMYVNDKSPTAATANNQGWATFRKVKLNGGGKLSFTRNDRPVNYTRTFNAAGGAVSFTPTSKPKPAATPVAPVATPATVPTPTPVHASQPTQPVNTGVNDTNLSNSNTYTNSNGDTVHSPAASTDGTVPTGATAQCKDGSYSFSQHRSGTCSGHSGVSRWL